MIGVSVVVPQLATASAVRPDGMRAVSPSPASSPLYDVSTSADTVNAIAIGPLVPRVAAEVAVPAVVLDEVDLLVAARRLHRVRAVADHQLVLAVPSGVDRRSGHRVEQLEAGHGGEVRVRRRQRDRERHGVVVGHHAGERVGGAGELLGAALDEVEQVGVVAGEVRVGRPLPRALERARQDRLAVAERLVGVDREGPHRGVVVGRGVGEVGTTLGFAGSLESMSVRPS